MYRGDALGDGHPPAALLSPSETPRLTLRWQRNLGAPVDGTPAVSGGVVVAGSANGKLGAYTLDNGARVWEDTGLGTIEGSAAIVGEQVLIGTLTGQVYAISLRDGSIQWTWRAPQSAAIWSSPVPYRNMVLVGTASQYGDIPLEPGRLVALDRASGRQLWSYCTEPQCQPGGGIWSSPMIDNQGRAFVGLGNPNDGVLAVQAATGRRLWETAFHPDLGRDLDVGASAVVLHGEGRERIAIGSVAGDFKMLDAENGAVIWSRQLDAGSAVHGLIGSPAYDGTSLYIPPASTPVSHSVQQTDELSGSGRLGKPFTRRLPSPRACSWSEPARCSAIVDSAMCWRSRPPMVACSGASRQASQYSVHRQLSARACWSVTLAASSANLRPPADSGRQ